MVQTTVTTKGIDLGQVSPQDTTVAPSRTKKRRVDGTESSKKQRRGKPGELCQLNLDSDVLFLVRTFPWISFRPFSDGLGGDSLLHTFTP